MREAIDIYAQQANAQQAHRVRAYIEWGGQPTDAMLTRYMEVLRRQGLKPGTVRVRLHRARLLLRQEMDKKLRGRSEKAHSEKAKVKAGEPARSKRPPACQETFANLSEYMDGRLEPKTCDQMRTHIEACPACLAFIRDLKAAIDRSRALKLPMDSDMGQSLRRMLAEEYLRLMKNGEMLARR